MALDTVTKNRSGWGTEDHVARECAVTLDFAPDVCDWTGSETLVQGGNVGYKTAPVGFVGLLDRPTNCTEDDDASFLDKALKNSTELAVAQALLTAPSGGPDAGVWFGHPDVMASPASPADVIGIGAARSEWYRHTVWAKQVRPLLHLPPSMMPTLKSDGLLVLSSGEPTTIWGDEVIFSPVYDWAGGVWAAWTGPINAEVSSVESTGTLVSKQNRATTGATQLVTVDTPPCAIVTVGAVPTL